MDESFFKIGSVVFSFFILSSLFSTCSRNVAQRPYPAQQAVYNTTINTLSYASDGLNLQAVGELMKSVQNAEEFEKQLNSSETGINNLDLDENGKVDYIKVTEYGSGDMRGFSLTTELSAGDVQEIATVEFEKSGDQVNTEIHGNPNMYGNNYYYRSHSSMTDVLFMYWLFSSRPFYSSPWGYGYYPNHYRSYRSIPNRDYQRNTARYSRSGNYQKQNMSTMRNAQSSPNKSKSSTKIKAPLKNPSSSQKSFQKRNPSKSIKSGGFGKSNLMKKRSKYSKVRTRSFSRPRMSFRRR